MKPGLLLALMVLTSSAFAADPGDKPAPRPRLPDAVLRRAAINLPAARRAKAIMGSEPTAQDADQYQVIGGEHGMVGRTNGPSPLTRPFDLVNGGTFKRFDGTYLTVEPKLQFDGPNAGWDLLKISWW